MINDIFILNLISGTATLPPAHHGVPRYNLSKVLLGHKQSP